MTQADGFAGLSSHRKYATAADLFGGLISGVVIGGETYTDSNGVVHKQNTYPNIRKILDVLGVTNNPVKDAFGISKSNVVDHNSHFHIYLAPPTALDIGPHLLLSGGLLAPPSDAISSNVTLQTEAQSLLDYSQTLITGDELMFIMDVPTIPAQQTPIVLAQATSGSAAGTTLQPDYILKDCQQTPSTGDPMSAMRGVDPAYMLKNYLEAYDKTGTLNVDLATIKNIFLLEGTTHGKIFGWTDGAGFTSYHYDPIPNYTGNDRAVFLAEFEGKIYKIVINIVVSPTVGESPLMSDETPVCPPPKLIKVNGKPVSGSSGDDLNTLTSASTGQTSTSFSTGITVSVADLPGGAIGQTVGEGINATITLDDNAANYNWFIDPTPADHSEFLPTSNPNEWVAKAGSDAAGKMDMLSVLLHEYGHALGIEHSADNHDYMATTLTPGVRRLPSADELALMQQLIGSVGRVPPADSTPDNSPTPFPTLPFGTTLSLAFLGRLRSSRYGGINIEGVLPYAPTTQYAVAANAAFVGLNGIVGWAPPTMPGGGPALDGWNTQGGVSFENGTSTGLSTGSATLNEVSTSQTRLSQVFMLNDNDRYLSFTLSGTTLDDLNGAPDDAFEVALLDANTGLSVLGGNGLTRTDAFLNLQGDGTQNAASCVTCINNADGSRTYRVDLTGVAKNTAVNLSFDLLGFGANNSHVTLRDIRVSGLPQLRDEVATLAEDNLLTFDPYAQADSQVKPVLSSSVVAAPTHGALAVNADGTFSYTPDLNYFGADSFSYRLSDGPLDSNLATVSLTVTPVNDAPVAADVAVTTAEDTPLVIALSAYASDVDSTPPLTRGGGEGFASSIVAGPTHGVLVQNADGTFSYTPEANYNGADSFTYKVNDGELDSNVATVTLAISAVNDAPTLGNLNLAAVEDTALPLNLLAAASDVDSTTLTAAIVATAQHGQVNINADGSFTYTPEANYNGADSFTYKVNDGELDSSIATVTLTVAAVNDAPVATDASVTLAEDGTSIIDLMALASDVDNIPHPLPNPPLEGAGASAPSLSGGRQGWGWGSAFIVDAPTHGVLAQNADGTYSYTPEANYNGADSFTYKVNDGQLDSNIATVSLNVTPVNDAPVAGNLNLAAVEDTALPLNLLAAASDIDSTTLTATIIATAQHGQVNINADGSFTYTPDANYNGADSFTYKVNDGELDSSIATVTLAITPVNDAPQGTSITVTTLEDTPYVFRLADFGFSDAQDALGTQASRLHADGTSALPDNFAAAIIGDLPQAGSLTLNGIAVTSGQSIAAADIAAGLLQLAPAANANGAAYASFTFRVQDDGGTANGGVNIDQTAKTLTLNISPVNDAPVAGNLNLATTEDAALKINLLAVTSGTDHVSRHIKNASISVMLNMNKTLLLDCPG